MKLIRNRNISSLPTITLQKSGSPYKRVRIFLSLHHHPNINFPIRMYINDSKLIIILIHLS